MGKKIDLTNEKFGKLIVQYDTGKRNSKGSVLWQCLCECGNYTLATSTELRNGHKKSCGCYQKECASKQGQKNLIDLTGKTFNKLTVIQRVSTKKTPSGATKIFWLCLCECGNKCVVDGNSLKTGNTKSCGCVKSFGEQKISMLLQTFGIPFEREKIFDATTNYRYDFYVDNKYIIEYDGKQHFEDSGWDKKLNIQQRDNEKNQYCYLNNIPIIRIPYTHYNSLCIEDLLLDTSQFILIKEEV